MKNTGINVSVSLKFDLVEQASVGCDTGGQKGGEGRHTATHGIDHLSGGFERHTTAFFLPLLFDTKGKNFVLFTSNLFFQYFSALVVKAFCYETVFSSSISGEDRQYALKRL